MRWRRWARGRLSDVPGMLLPFLSLGHPLFLSSVIRLVLLTVGSLHSSHLLRRNEGTE